MRTIVPILLFSIIPLPGIGAPSPASEIQSINLIRSGSYDPRHDPAKAYNQLSSVLGVAIADLFINVPDKIEKQISDKLEEPEIKKYFPSRSERSQFSKRISREVAQKFFKNGVSNSSLVQAIQYTANSMIGQIIDRVMLKEGVRDPERRKAWANKILSPINHCLQAAQAYAESSACVENYQADLTKNIGLGLGYELINQEVGPQYLGGYSAQYTACIRGPKATVMNCVLQAMRRGAVKAASDKVASIATEKVPGSEALIAGKTIPSFGKCVSTASAKQDFRRCADDLTIKAGTEIAGEAIRQNEQVRKHIPEQVLPSLSSQEQTVFAVCMKENQKNNRRDLTGSLLTANCSSRVRLDTAKAVAYELFRVNINENVKAGKKAREKMSQDIYAQLSSCWNSDADDEVNNSCLKTTAKELINTIADPQLGKQIPAGLQAKEPKFKSDQLKLLRDCLETHLPENMMVATDTTEKIAGCTGQLARSAAMKVADFQLRDALFGRSDKKTVDQLVDKLVTKSFSECLGTSPNMPLLEKCSVTLRISAGNDVAKVLVPDEVEKFLKDHGGDEAFGLNAASKNDLIQPILGAHEKCLKEPPLPKGGNSADRYVDNCFKKTVRDLASRLGKMEFARSGKTYFKGDEAAGEKMADDFAVSFIACLDEAPANFTLKLYLKKVDECRVRLTAEFTQKVAKRQLTTALERSLPGNDAAVVNERNAISSELIGSFEHCTSLEGADDAESISRCTRTLQVNAMESIAIAAGRAKVEKLLGVRKMPERITEVENGLHTCLKDPQTEPDLCGKKFIVSLAKTLVDMKLHRSMAEVMGMPKYQKFKSKINDIQNELNQCLKLDLSGALDGKFLSAVEHCTDVLEENALAFLQERFAEEFSRPSLSEAEAKLNRDFAVAIPCLEAVAPSSPYEDKSIEALNPEGMISDFAQLIGNYINYDLEKAGDDYQKVLGQLVTDIEAAGPEEARVRLIDSLVKRGMLDQLIKSIVRDKVSSQLKALPKEDRLNPALEKLLSDKKTLEKVLTPEYMAKIRPFILDNVVRPILIEGNKMSDPKVDTGLKLLERQVMTTLIESPHFGDILVDGKIQEGIDSTNSFYRFIGRTYLNYRTYKWEEVKDTPAGKEAAAYLRDKIIRPRLEDEAIDPKEMAARRQKLDAMVKEALKNPAMSPAEEPLRF